MKAKDPHSNINFASGPAPQPVPFQLQLPACVRVSYRSVDVCLAEQRQQPVNVWESEINLT